MKQTTAESRKVLKAVKARFPMVLVSNFYGNIGTVLGEFGLDGLFDSVIESAAFTATSARCSASSGLTVCLTA